MASPEQEARALLKDAKIHDNPVPVERIAKQLRARLSFEPFEGNISGMLYRDGKRTVIGVNSAQANTRQRFTIAHEIGHLRLHRGRPIIVDEVVRVNFRDSRSSQATDTEEIEANQFAAELLMPRDLVQQEVKRRASKRGLTSDDWLVEQLARAFDVSPQAMEYRLANLGFRLLR